MKAKSVVPRERVERDVDEANDQYLSDNAPGAALGFIAALEEGYRHIGRYPGTGSSCFAGELSLPGLRFRRLENYPHLIFTASGANTSMCGACFTACATFLRGCTIPI